MPQTVYKPIITKKPCKCKPFVRIIIVTLLCIIPLTYRKYYLYGGDNMDKTEIPIGFSMALATNPDAMQVFSSLSEYKKQQIIQGTHLIKSKAEMQQYVNDLVSNVKNNIST